MFCPNCGANNSTEQKFCRSCGLNLEKSAESLLEQLPTAQSATLLKHEKLIERFGNFALGGLGVVVLFGTTILIYTVIDRFLYNGTNIYVAILLVSFIVFALLSLVFVIFNETLKEKKAKINPAVANELGDKNCAAKFLEEKPFEPVTSVAENTTKLFAAKLKRTSGDL